MESPLTTILVLLFLAIGIGALVTGAVFHDYEHEKKKCGNCALRDDAMHYCWSRGFDVGTETKACSLFQNKHKV